MDTEPLVPEEEAEVEENILTLMHALPQALQDFLRSPERTRIVAALAQKYSLHVDQAGEFERGFLFMLLGVWSPAEFVQKLEEAGLTTDVVNSLTKDLNEQVFMRLRDRELAGSAPARPASVVQASQPIQVEPRKPEPLPVPAIAQEYRAAPQPILTPVAPIPTIAPPTPVFSSATAIEALPTQPSATILSQSVRAFEEPAPIQQPTQPIAMPHARTMAGDMQAYSATGKIPETLPVPEPIAVAAPRPTPPPSTRSMPPAASEPFAPAPVPLKPSVPHSAAPLPGKDYSADPYREPVE